MPVDILEIDVRAQATNKGILYLADRAGGGDQLQIRTYL